MKIVIVPTYLFSQLPPSSSSTRRVTMAFVSVVDWGDPVGPPCSKVRMYSPIPPTTKGTHPLETMSCVGKSMSCDGTRPFNLSYVNRRGPRRKGVNMDVILSSLSLMAASLLALVRGIAIIIMQAVIAAVLVR